MKIEVLQEHLITAVNQLQKIIPTKAQLPILSTILMTVHQNTIKLSGTDLFIGMQIDVPGKVVKEGTIAIPAKIFRDYIASLHPGKITLILDENSLLIEADGTKTTLQCVSSAEFPEFPEVSGESFNLTLLDLTIIDTQIRFATSLDLTRPILTSLLFQFSDLEMLVVATDGFRLATIQLASNKAFVGNSLLLPSKAIGEVVKIATQQKVEVIKCLVSLEQKQVLFMVGLTKIFVRMIEGEYPPFNKIIPGDFKINTLVDGQEFEDQLKRAIIFSRETSNIVKLMMSNQELKITSMSSSYGSYDGIISLEKKIEHEITIAFNARYVLDFLAALKPDKVEINLNEPLTPVLFRPAGMKEYRYIVMPFKINE